MNKNLSPEELLRLRDIADAMRQDAAVTHDQLMIAERVLAGKSSNPRQDYEAVV